MATATATAKKTAIFPDEVFLNAAIKDRRAVKKELSMKAIGVPDARLQQRVKTDVNHVRLLEGILREGERLRPIVAFEEQKPYAVHVADGFHRHGAHVNFGASSIWAWVIEGSWRDAMVYSTMCNRNLCLKRTSEDIKKAVMTLLDDEVWRGKADSVIADHCGVCNGSVSKYRLEHSEMRGVPIPEKVERRDGQTILYRRFSDSPRVEVGANGRRRASFGGRQKTIPKDIADAQAEVDSWIADQANQKRRLEPGLLRAFLGRRGFLFAFAEFDSRLGLGGVSKGHGVVLVSDSFDRRPNGYLSNAVPTAVGRVLLARQLIDPTARAVVVCYIEDAPAELIEAGRALGVEFLTPDELVASLKGEESRESA